MRGPGPLAAPTWRRVYRARQRSRETEILPRARATTPVSRRTTPEFNGKKGEGGGRRQAYGGRRLSSRWRSRTC